MESAYDQDGKFMGDFLIYATLSINFNNLPFVIFRFPSYSLKIFFKSGPFPLSCCNRGRLLRLISTFVILFPDFNGVISLAISV